ncbi:TPA: RHS domain-containing protein [Pseudomonas putida]|nr:RHS domain-containing protein [Pseudomonas putida]
MAAVVTYYHNDISGSPLAATDGAGNLKWKESYKPYGDKLTRSAASGDNDMGFHGKVHDDSTGLSYMGARYYDPVLGRFTGVDPVDFQTDNLHSFNRYAYTNNNPYKYVDPDGKQALSQTLSSFFARLLSALTGRTITTNSNNGSNQDLGGFESSFKLDNTPSWADQDNTSSWKNRLSFNEEHNEASDDDFEIPDAPVGKLTARDDKWWKNQGVDAHEEKANYGDSRRNLAIDSRSNVWTVDRFKSTNPEFLGRLKDMRRK